MKYILVSGGVISGIGKGIISSSIGTLLKAFGLRVTAIKVDPYLNIDAGTFSPYEHGEVFVLNDGGEVDLDLGNYERFLDVSLTRDNNITTGKIYQEVINRERKGDYLGKTVQVIPHITDAIQSWIERVARIPVDSSKECPNVCLVELGGVVGDIESAPFLEALRLLRMKVGIENFCSIHVSLVPSPSATGEQKSKPTQSSVRELRSAGIAPNIIMCRSQNALTESIKEKVHMFCEVRKEHVISVTDAATVYEVPINLYRANVHNALFELLKLENYSKCAKQNLKSWRELTHKVVYSTQTVRIGVVGKYIQLPDSYLSIYKAITHACAAFHLKADILKINSEDLKVTPHDVINGENPEYVLEAWKHLRKCDGVIVAGGFGARGILGKLAAINYCRTKNVPFLGICLGMQCAVIEFARNELGIPDADSTEFCPDTKSAVVIEMPEHHVGNMGGTMRLGCRRTVFTSSFKKSNFLSSSPARNCSSENLNHCEKNDCCENEEHSFNCHVNSSSFEHNYNVNDMHAVRENNCECVSSESGSSGHWSNPFESIVKSLYNNVSFIEERHRHRYEINPLYVEALSAAGLRVTGTSEDGQRMEIVELIEHPFFVGTQFHPEYKTRPLKPSAIFLGLILASIGRLDSYLSGRKINGRSDSLFSTNEDDPCTA